MCDILTGFVQLLCPLFLSLHLSSPFPTPPLHLALPPHTHTSGVIVACWQTLPSGTEPAELRAALAEALPLSPKKEGQMVKEPSMLHTTIARLLRPPEELHTQVGGHLTREGWEWGGEREGERERGCCGHQRSCTCRWEVI